MSARCSTGPGRDWDEAWSDQLKVSARGTFVFTINDVDEDTGMSMIEVNADSPLTYPWPARITDLVSVED